MSWGEVGQICVLFIVFAGGSVGLFALVLKAIKKWG